MRRRPPRARRRGAPDGSLRVAYGRFQRDDAPTVFWLRPVATRVAGEGGDTRLCADRDFLEGWRVVAFEPAAESEEARGREICYRFRVAPAPPAADAGPAGVAIRAEPRDSAFPARGALRLDGRAPLALSVWVWP